MMEQKRIGEHFNFCIAMKNLFKSIMIVAAAAMSFTSCSNNFTEEAVSGEKIEINVNATNDEITRSAFGEPSEGSYPTLWDGKEKFVMNANDSSGKTTETVTAKFSADLRTVNLSANFEFEAPQTSYTAYAMVPKSACVFTGITANKGWQIAIPTAQTTGANSCDPAAQILMGASETKTSAAEAFNMTFKHAVAYGKMTLTNLNLGDATISSVAIESTKNIAGRFYINHKTLAYSDNSGAKSITINTTSSDNIWFALAPVDVSNTTLKIVVNTNKGTFTKQVTMPANRKFELGKISIFKVDMTGIALVAPVQYTLLTDVANLKVGDEVVIAAKDANYAISSTQNNNNRGQAAITKGSDKSTISDPGSAVEIFTVEAGSTSGTFAFKAQKYAGYIYAASSGSNHMKTQSTKDANASWSISVTTAGVATIKAQGSNTRNWLRYNETSSLFSCYGSGQKDVVIYHLAATPADPNAPSITLAQNEIEVEATATNAETAITLTNVDEVDLNVDYDDWIDDAWVEDGMLYISFSANTTTASRSATIIISANGAEAKVTITQKGKAVPAAEITIKEFLAKGVDANVEYILRGTITRVVNTSYGNFDITDETGTVYIYGLVSPDGNTNKYWATSKAKLGDDIVIKTVRADYNGTPQGINAKFVELITPGTLPFYNVDFSVVQLPYTGGNSDVNISVYNTTATVTATSNNPAITATVNGYKVTISATANETEQTIEGIVTIKVGDLNSTDVNVTIAGKPAEGQVVGGSDDFDTVSTNTSYVKTTTKAGWVADNCAVLSGGDSDASPAFKMIGASTNRAFCMNGKTSAVGTITSPTLNTGCGTLSFNYGLPFSDNKIKFRVDIKQNNSVVKTFTVNNTSAEKNTLYSHEEVVNVAGDFQIVFTNLSPSSSTSNKDRTAVWDVEWTGYQN